MNRAKFKRLAKKSLELFMGEDGKAHMAITKETAEEFLGAKIIVQEGEE